MVSARPLLPLSARTCTSFSRVLALVPRKDSPLTPTRWDGMGEKAKSEGKKRRISLGSGSDLSIKATGMRWALRAAINKKAAWRWRSAVMGDGRCKSG